MEHADSHVLPVPVCPYAKMVPLKPLRTSSTIGLPTLSKRSCCAANSPKTCSCGPDWHPVRGAGAAAAVVVKPTEAHMVNLCGTIRVPRIRSVRVVQPPELPGATIRIVKLCFPARVPTNVASRLLRDMFAGLHAWFQVSGERSVPGCTSCKCGERACPRHVGPPQLH